MGDLEMTKLCAEAMGLDWRVVGPVDHEPNAAGGWNPLDDDEQAMALVKRFELSIVHQDGVWVVGQRGHRAQGSGDLNRSIVGAVAMMQAAKVAV